MEMPQVDTLRRLIIMIQLSRSSTIKDLGLEEELFSLLIQIYRSTEALELWTEARSKED